MSFEDHPVNRLHKEGAPQLFDCEQDAILAKGVAKFEELTGRTLSDGQVEMFMLETVAYMISLHAMQCQVASESNLAAFAEATWLEAIGVGRDRSRHPAAPASCQMMFSRADDSASGIEIPAGTRVSDASGEIVFLTQEAAYLASAVDQVHINAKAALPGQIANGFEVGAISQLIDPIVGIGAVSNLAATFGGADQETLTNYRARVALSSERLGDGLSEERYVSDVLDWSNLITDVTVVRPQAGHVNLYPLMQSGLPSEEARASLKGFFDASNIHQGDFIQVFSPVARAFTFTLQLKLTAPSGEADAEGVVQTVLDAWSQTLGGYISPSELIRAARGVEGVLEADIPDLLFAVLANNEWRHCTGFTIDADLL